LNLNLELHGLQVWKINPSLGDSSKVASSFFYF